MDNTVNDARVYKNVIRCINCGNLKLVEKICICESVNQFDKICIVENLADMWVIEAANIFKGCYHILGGTLNSNENYEQKNLLIEALIKRIKKNNLKEVISIITIEKGNLLFILKMLYKMIV